MVDVYRLLFTAQMQNATNLMPEAGWDVSGRQYILTVTQKEKKSLFYFFNSLKFFFFYEILNVSLLFRLNANLVSLRDFLS